MNLFFLVLGCFSLQTHVCGMNSAVPTELCESDLKDWFNYYGSISRSRVCLKETYIPGHANNQFQNECLVEPENEELSFADSAWTYYKCIVKKALGSTPLTLNSYAEWMTGNMSAPTKSAIISFLNDTQNESKLTETNLNSTLSDIPDLQNLEKYWNAYFVAEYHVCKNISMIPCEDNMVKLKHKWPPKESCSESRNIPFINIKYKQDSYTYTEFMNCSLSYTERHRHASTNGTRAEIQRASYAWCDLVVRGLVPKEQDESEIHDFVPLYNEIMTRSFYSKKVKRQAFNLFKEMFSHVYSKQNETILQSESVKDVFSYTVQHLQAQFVEQGHIPANLNFLANGNILHSINRFKGAVPFVLCNRNEK